MSAARRHRKHHHEEHENHERWLVSGYDMMTLLFAVFVVLFAISSTNKSKIVALQMSLQEAFSGPVLSGGRAMQQTGSASEDEQAAPSPPLPTLTPVEAVEQAMRKGEDPPSSAAAAEARTKAAADEEAHFQALKRRIDKLVAEAGLADKVSTTVAKRGLRIRLLTDRLLFDSGSADLEHGALPTLERIAGVIAAEGRHPVEVEGHTDSRAIATYRYPSNWQLSGARAGAVVQRLTAGGVSAGRLSLAGYADAHPIATNRTVSGRSRNRRVEVVLTRLHGAHPSQGGTQP